MHLSASVIIALLVLCPFIGHTKEVYPSSIQEFTLEEAVALAKRVSEKKMAMQALELAIQQQGRAQKAIFSPTISIQAGYTRNQSLPTFPFGPFGEIESGRKNDYQATLHVEQFLWSFGKRKAIKRQIQATNQFAQENVNIIVRDVAYLTRKAITELWFTKAQYTVAKDRVLQRQNELDDARELRKMGMVTELDVRQGNIQVIQAKDALQEAQTSIKDKRTQIARLLAMDSDMVQIKGKLERPQHPEEYVTKAKHRVEDSYTYIMLNKQHDILREEQRILRAASLPEFYAVIDVREEGSNIDSLQDSWSVGLTMRWDIYRGGSTTAKIKESAERVREIYHQKKQFLRDRHQQIESLAIRLYSLDSRIMEQERAKQLSTKNYADARKQYQAGWITLNRVGDMNLSVSEARFRYLQLVHDEQQIALELLRLSE